MPKCCAYGIPNDPQGAVIRFTLCADDNQSCPQFTQWLNLGSWPVASCSDCKVPDMQPRLKCCAYGIPNDPEGQVVRFTLCTPESEPCPQFAAYTNLGSWVVANCEDCKPPPALTPSPDIGLSCTCLIAGVINLTDDYCGNRISHAACRFDYPSTGLCRWAVPGAALPRG